MALAAAKTQRHHLQVGRTGIRDGDRDGRRPAATVRDHLGLGQRVVGERLPVALPVRTRQLVDGDVDTTDLGIEVGTHVHQRRLAVGVEAVEDVLIDGEDAIDRARS